MTTFRPQVIIACGSGLFCGSGKNKTRVLHALGKLGIATHYVTTSTPHLTKQCSPIHFTTHIASPPRSDFLTDASVFTSLAIAERMTELALGYIRDRRQIPILWGTYLFPFVEAATMAKRNIAFECGELVPLISSPAGSDIWQVGASQYHNVRTMMYDTSVDCCVTYSDSFRANIRRSFGSHRPIHVVPPILDFNQFSMPTIDEKQAIRRSLGIPLETIVVIHHSNMRPIKNPALTYELVYEAASKLQDQEKICLLLVGPQPSMLTPDHQLNHLQAHVLTTVSDRLTVLWTGLVDDVTTYIRASDLAVNCSIHDSFNISLLEAMACGIPCITTDVVGIAQHIVASFGGYVITTVDPYSATYSITDPSLRTKALFVEPDAFVAAVLRLVRDPDLRTRMGYNASAYMQQHFNEQLIVDTYMRLFQDVRGDYGPST